MRTLLVGFSLLLIVAAAACSKAKKEGAGESPGAGSGTAVAAAPAEADEADDSKAKMYAESATKSVTKAKEALAAGKPLDGNSDCTVATTGIEFFEKNPKYAAVGKDVRDFCWRELPLAIIKIEVEKAEAARKAKPKDVLTECHNTEYSMALKELEMGGATDAAKELVERFKAACPNS